jgi:sulfatase maturation enzyme AslB (radical SAM superfamily)
MQKDEIRFSPNICVTHECNLNCIYCYQKHNSGEKMSFETAKKSINWIFSNIPSYADGVEIGFIGGEPLLEFSLIKRIFDYIHDLKPSSPYIFYATTNGTVLTETMKEWFRIRKKCFWLGLSLDGKKETHDHNRCSSYDKIDLDFFLHNWPEQGVKMTLSDYSLGHLADNIKYIHSLGFKKISGVNLAEGNFDWDKEAYLKLIIPQFVELVDFYVENDNVTPDMMFDLKLSLCESKNNEHKKWCGIGVGTPFFDIDGTRYPCSFITPMTFSSNELEEINQFDFNNDKLFVDTDCSNKCYIYPICSTCYGANYMVNKEFNKRNKSKCKIQKLLALFIADMQAKRIQKNPKRYDDTTLYYTIEAIKNIRELYLKEFEKHIKQTVA